ncbi:hypothetical protein AAG906_006563 [Vitis piasezkii]
MSSDKLESFPIRFTGKNYYAWEFQFKLFVKGKELWGHIDGSNPAPRDAEAFSKWEIKDAQVMTWILSSVEPHLVLNLRPYKSYCNYVELSPRFTIKTTRIFFGFQTLWTNYSDIIYAYVPDATLSLSKQCMQPSEINS